MSQRKTTLLLSLVALATCFLVPLLIGKSTLVSRNETKTSATPPAIKPSPSDALSKQPADVTLAREIDRAIDASDLTRARWGVFVVSMKDGRVLVSRNGDKLFTPASNMKIYTTAVALDLLGADYHWRTSVYADKQPDAGGVIDGDLTLYGRGAPDLDNKKGLVSLANQLYQGGVRRVRGNIIGDDSYFRGEQYGLGWQWNDLQWYFGAEPSALTVDENSVELTIAPANKVGSNAILTLNRGANYLHLTNHTLTAERDATTTIGINRGLSDNELLVWGDFPVGGRPFNAFLSVPKPALWAATLFKAALIARGIKVEGETRSRDFRVTASDKFDPQKAIEIAQENSAALSEIVRHTNKESDNLYAELILRTLGKERGASAPDPDPRKNRERGDDEAGTAVVKAWLDHNGVGTDDLAIRDGSGLSRLDLVTPEATASLLAAVARTNSATAFRDSLPIAGRDGTLSGRLSREAGRVFAKTGTLTYDHSLSGYAVTPTHETLAFAIFCNDATSQSNPVWIIDQIAGLIAEAGSARSTK
ncbi:MAG TPA: D-alanyl-D-alanine carboxypeptidase/D-alanyl-D-alanine-endopeptidase [Pyrinomonadaceae bacterium]|nr:D-alanyl-D-alanine carboxypeptidase/D-alanyl-D-alanine-endopeptidase [Pyrinomonadaceae bacterium]